MLSEFESASILVSYYLELVGVLLSLKNILVLMLPRISRNNDLNYSVHRCLSRVHNWHDKALLVFDFIRKYLLRKVLLH